MRMGNAQLGGLAKEMDPDPPNCVEVRALAADNAMRSVAQ